MEYGTPEQKAFFLPRILAGECHFAIGYSEPGAGTDLASLRTRAVRDGDHYVITGNKVFTSLAEHADYIWLAARTDPSAPKHKGISMLIVDTHLPVTSARPSGPWRGCARTRPSTRTYGCPPRRSSAARTRGGG